MIKVDENKKIVALEEQMRKLLTEYDRKEVLEVLEGSVPKGASIGEMILHTSKDLTLLFARIPPFFQSGIHNHTIFAVIAQLEGTELNHAYEKRGDVVVRAATKATTAGNLIALDADAIHAIENPDATPALALHAYGGDFHAVMAERTLWSAGAAHEPLPFSFPGLMRESLGMMKAAGNSKGLLAVAEAMPALKPQVESLL